MQSILSVTVPADSFDLTTVATVRAVAGITEAQVSDANMETLIQQASGICADYCDRVFGLETVSETFRLGWRDGGCDPLILSRRPVASIASVDVDGAAIDASNYEIDYARGLVQRLSSDQPTSWGGNKITVVYTAGYELLDALPYGIERACIELIRGWWTSGSTGGRDTSVRRESVEIPGVRTIQQEYFAAGASAGTSADAVPANVAELLNPHREIFV